ncbi:hypothetical protein Rt10032_c05g2298 [Rhodotorula toruloides]|uniref:Uncharacterized protein n=1 Tax=Rhodotorula toruloides TaxID=5286 RepID=A0A511KD29_RHOTO|nr:hypothetical protein Rt10032_c05g2298 [Rhodotorula toruloides]
MPLLTYNGRSVYVDATCYAEADAAANRVFFASSGAPPPRFRFKLGWPLGSFTQEFAASVELEKGSWPEGLLPQNTQLWIVLEQAAPLQIEGPAAAADLHAAHAVEELDESIAAAQDMDVAPAPVDIGRERVGAAAAAASPTPTLLISDEMDDELLNESWTAITDAKGIPCSESLTCPLLLMRKEGSVWDYGDATDEIWLAEKATISVFLTPDDACVVDLRFFDEPYEHSRRYNAGRGRKTVILDVRATVLDLRRKLAVEGSQVYDLVALGDVLVFPSTDADSAAKETLQDDVALASCRKAGHPRIRLWASTRNAEELWKEEENRTAKRRKITAKLARFIVRD